MKKEAAKGKNVMVRPDIPPPSTTTNIYTAIQDLDDDARANIIQIIKQIQKAEEKEKKYYADEVAKLLTEDNESDNGSETDAQTVPLSNRSLDVETSVANPLEKTESQNQLQDATYVNEDTQQHEPGNIIPANDSLEFVSETPDVLIVREEENLKPSIGFAVPAMPEVEHNTNNSNPISFLELERPNSVAPSWSQPGPNKGNKRKGVGKGNKKRVRVHHLNND